MTLNNQLENKIHLGDCFEILPQIEDSSIDLILCDLPYGITEAEWDIPLPLDKLWEHYLRVIKPQSAILLTATQPFTTSLISSMPSLFRYCWYWEKPKPNGWQNSKNKPMTCIEEIVVFSKGKMGHQSQLKEKRMNYFPQGLVSEGIQKMPKWRRSEMLGERPEKEDSYYERFSSYPKNLLRFNNVSGRSAKHPTQKPVDLFEYLIKTYTKEGDLVLDNCIGSGTTALACINTNRRFIGIEKEERFYKIACERVGCMFD